MSVRESRDRQPAQHVVAALGLRGVLRPRRFGRRPPRCGPARPAPRRSRPARTRSAAHRSRAHALHQRPGARRRTLRVGARSNCAHVVNVLGSRTRSRKIIPSRWSTSCWNVPAVRPRRSSSCSAPSRSVHRTRTVTARSTSPRRSGTDRQPSLIANVSSSNRRQHRVDDHGQRDRRLVRVSRVRLGHLDDRHAAQVADLVGGEPGAARSTHRVDQIVDKPLELRRGELLGGHLAGALAQGRVADLEDGQHRSSTAPASGPARRARARPRSRARSPRRRAG